MAVKKSQRVVTAEIVARETVKLGDLHPGNRFVLEGTRYYIVTNTEEGILCMSLIQVKEFWSGGEYKTFDPDTMVEKLSA